MMSISYLHDEWNDEEWGSDDDWDFDEVDWDFDFDEELEDE